MLDQGGQTHPSLDEVSCSVAKPLIFLGKLPPRRPENLSYLSDRAGGLVALDAWPDPSFRVLIPSTAWL
jgi:hypothetical protein